MSSAAARWLVPTWRLTERIEHAQERLERGFMVCDALYAFCRQTREAAREV